MPRCGECGSDAVVDWCPPECERQTHRAVASEQTAAPVVLVTVAAPVTRIETLSTCSKCGGRRYGSGVHARRAAMRGGESVWIDCVGDVVSKEE